MISKRKLRDKAVEAEKEKQTGESDDRKEKDKGKDITDRLKDANIGPIRMSDRKSKDSTRVRKGSCVGLMNKDCRRTTPIWTWNIMPKCQAIPRPTGRPLTAGRPISI